MKAAAKQLTVQSSASNGSSLLNATSPFWCFFTAGLRQILSDFFILVLSLFFWGLSFGLNYGACRLLICLSLLSEKWHHEALVGNKRKHKTHAYTVHPSPQALQEVTVTRTESWVSALMPDIVDLVWFAFLSQCSRPCSVFIDTAHNGPSWKELKQSGQTVRQTHYKSSLSKRYFYA